MIDLCNRRPVPTTGGGQEQLTGKKIVLSLGECSLTEVHNFTIFMQDRRRKL
jgi:hypothetical protein